MKEEAIVTLSDRLAEGEVETLVATLARLKNLGLVDTLVHRLGVIDVKTPGNKLAEKLMYTLADRVTEVEVKTLSDTLAEVQGKVVGNTLAYRLTEVKVNTVTTHWPSWRPRRWSTHWLRGELGWRSRHFATHWARWRLRSWQITVWMAGRKEYRKTGPDRGRSARVDTGWQACWCRDQLSNTLEELEDEGWSTRWLPG